MRPRRKTFGELFIEETVSDYLTALADSAVESSELIWAKQVLSEFFESVALENSPKLQRAKAAYVLANTGAEESNINTSVPLPQAAFSGQVIGISELTELFRLRKSVRWYTDEPIDPNTVRVAMDAAAQAPSACNRQPFRCLVLSDLDTIKTVANLAGGAGGFCHQIPCLLVLVGDLSNYFDARDRHLIHIDGALFAMQLQLALRSLGLASCVINWGDEGTKDKKMENLFGLQAYEKTIMLMSIGYADPDGGVPFSQKKSAVSLEYNRVEHGRGKSGKGL